MQLQEEELVGLEYIQDEYSYKDWINNLKSPKVIGIGKDKDGFVCFLSGDTPHEIYELAKTNSVKNLELTIPQKHIFKK